MTCKNYFDTKYYHQGYEFRRKAGRKDWELAGRGVDYSIQKIFDGENCKIFFNGLETQNAQIVLFVDEAMHRNHVQVMHYFCEAADEATIFGSKTERILLKKIAEGIENLGLNCDFGAYAIAELDENELKEIKSENASHDSENSLNDLGIGYAPVPSHTK